jgi:hypothetical protein
MTDQEILEAQTPIADMRNVLTVLTGTTDADKLIALVLEKVRPLLGDVYRVVQRMGAVSGLDHLDDRFNYPLSVLIATAEVVQREPEHKARLVDAVATNVPRIEAVLDKIAQALREKAPKAPEVS